MVVTQFPLQRAQEIQQVLLVGWRERTDRVPHHLLGQVQRHASESEKIEGRVVAMHGCRCQKEARP